MRRNQGKLNVGVRFGCGLRKICGFFIVGDRREFLSGRKVNRGIEVPRPGHFMKNKESNLVGKYSICREGDN